MSDTPTFQIGVQLHTSSVFVQVLSWLDCFIVWTLSSFLHLVGLFLILVQINYQLPSKDGPCLVLVSALFSPRKSGAHLLAHHPLSGRKPLRVGSTQALALTQQLGPPQPTSLVFFTSTQNTKPVARTSKDPGRPQPSLARQSFPGRSPWLPEHLVALGIG